MNKYEEALARARKGLPLNEIFPELKTTPGDKWVDLGLPSGRLWAAENEADFYDFDNAVETFGKELPTKEAWGELFDKCASEWDDEKKGYLLTGPNGNTIFLPAAGCRSGTSVYFAGLGGHYWSSSPSSTATTAYGVGFFAGGVRPQGYSYRFYGFSVRLAINSIPAQGESTVSYQLLGRKENQESKGFDEAHLDEKITIANSLPTDGEWSEDEKMLDFAIRAIGLCRQYAINNQINGYSSLPDSPQEYKKLQSWLGDSIKIRIKHK